MTRGLSNVLWQLFKLKYVYLTLNELKKVEKCYSCINSLEKCVSFYVHLNFDECFLLFQDTFNFISLQSWPFNSMSLFSIRSERYYNFKQLQHRIIWIKFGATVRLLFSLLADEHIDSHTGKLSWKHKVYDEPSAMGGITSDNLMKKTQWGNLKL